MAIKVYRANDVREALAHMQMDMGSEAFVLYQRQLPASRWWPFGSKRWEVIASDQGARPVTAASEGHTRQLEAEVAELKASLERLVQAANLGRLPRAGKALTACYEHLCRKGIPAEIAQDVVLAAREELSTSAQSRPELVREAAKRQLAKLLHIRMPQAVPGSGPLVVFLLGQAGVGKTTTLAKLAARQVLYEGQRAAIINTDTTRPASQPQLEALASAAYIAVDAALGASGLEDALARHTDKDVVFVDTPGYNRHDASQLERLAALVNTAPRRQAFLVLSSSTLYGEMDQTLRSFRPLGVNGIILSKVDETELIGAAITLATQPGVPVAYFTNGRRVPDDLHAATPQLLTSLLFPEDDQIAEEPAPTPARRARPKKTTTGRQSAVAAKGGARK